MKSLKIIIGFIAAAGVLSTTNATETSSAQFLKMGAGARAAAMGNAFTSVSDDATAAYWNPAGLTQVKKVELALMQNSGLVDTTYQYAGAAFPRNDSTVALSIYRQDYGSIERYTANDDRDGSFDAGSMAASFSFGKKASEALSWGLTAKLIQESIESEKASGFAGDIGILYKTDAANFGFAVQHIGSGMKFVQERGSLPQTIRGGVSRSFFQEKLLGALEISKANDNDATLHSGLEYSVSNLLTLRGGYQVTPGNDLGVTGLTNISAGFGMQLNRFNLDYAFLPFGELGNTHRLSLLIKFDRP